MYYPRALLTAETYLCIDWINRHGFCPDYDDVARGFCNWRIVGEFRGRFRIADDGGLSQADIR
jgi:hypothetical protein